MADDGGKTDRLRALRLADEEGRKQAGTWGEVMVGEVVHASTDTVYVQTWKGVDRPDMLAATNARAAGVPDADWQAFASWRKRHRLDEFTQRMIRWHPSAAEAQRVKDATMASHRAAGGTVINPPPEETAGKRASGGAAPRARRRPAAKPDAHA